MSDIFKPGPSELVKVERGLKSLENEVYQEAAEILYSAIAHPFDLDLERKAADGTVEIPAAWLEEVVRAAPEDRDRVLDDLNKRKRIALAALMSPKNAPVAFALAKSVFIGMQKARAMEGNGNRTLNLTVVSITDPRPQFEEQEVSHE